MKIVPLVMLHLLIAVSAHAQERLPVIDMHLYAQAADTHGPPPLGMCTPMADPWPAWDPATPYGEVFMAIFTEPACDDPIWSPMTDEEVLAGAIAVMERNNVYGVLSGAVDRVAAWMEAAPGRFLLGYSPGATEDPADGVARSSSSLAKASARSFRINRSGGLHRTDGAVRSSSSGDTHCTGALLTGRSARSRRVSFTWRAAWQWVMPFTLAPTTRGSSALAGAVASRHSVASMSWRGGMLGTLGPR